MKKKSFNVRKLNLAYTHRAMMLWEYIAGRSFELNGSITDAFLFLWCVIEANNPGVIEITELENHCDKHPDDAAYLNGWLADALVRRGQMSKNDDAKKKAKKEPA